MSKKTFLKQNDTAPEFVGTLRDGNGVPVDLSGATARFLMRDGFPPRELKIDQPAVIIDAPNGQVQYNWAAADTDTAGVFHAEVEITFGTGEVETFPSTGYHQVVIDPDVA